MTIKVFEYFPTWSEMPVTLFAEDFETARQIFNRWVTAHYRHQRAEVEMIYPYTGSKLPTRPLLKRATADGMAGIGYWDCARHNWNIATPEDQPTGELTPPEGQDLARFTIHRGSRWELTGARATLPDDLEAEITGVAREGNDGIGRVLPPLRACLREGLTGEGSTRLVGRPAEHSCSSRSRK